MTNFDKISNGVCPFCESKLKKIEYGSDEAQECEKCNLIYKFVDDMGPGSYRIIKSERIQDMYQNITFLFTKEMIEQLKANSKKGDRDINTEGWLSQQPLKLVIDIYYHVGKLQEAVRRNDFERIKEYSADVANISMMVLDRCGGLLPLPGDIEPIKTPTIEWNKL